MIFYILKVFLMTNLTIGIILSAAFFIQDKDARKQIDDPLAWFCILPTFALIVSFIWPYGIYETLVERADEKLHERLQKVP